MPPGVSACARLLRCVDASMAPKHGASFLFGALAAGVDSLPACALKRGREGAVRRLLIGRSAFTRAADGERI